jgi:hypothetical protein
MAHTLSARTVVAPATETFRLVILDREGTKVLTVPSVDGFVLPSVVIPRWQRVAESLTAAVKTECGQEIICLYAPDIVFTLENGDRVS